VTLGPPNAVLAVKGVREHGFALLIVLWSVVLLALLATQITAAGRTETQLVTNLRAAAEAEAAADGAVQAAAFHLLDPAAPWAANGQEHVLRVGNAITAVRVYNEGGKINPNLADPVLMQALLRECGVDQRAAERLAAAIADWRTPAQARQPDGVRAAPYRAAGLDYGPPGTAFVDLDELGLVLGMTPTLLSKLRPYLSVYTDTAPDPAAASVQVRQAMQSALGRQLSITLSGPPRTVAVTARAAGSRGGHFTRRAVLRLGRSAETAPMLVLTWDAGEE